MTGGLSTRASTSRVLLASALLVAVGCSDKNPDYSMTHSAVCAVDEDGDGFGLGCPKGDDCNDGDAKQHDGCLSCDQPNAGCACAPGSRPVECMTQALIDENTLLCHSGTRYCQDGLWGECVGVSTFKAPVPAKQALVTTTEGLIDPNASGTSCSPCRPSCFPVDDPLDVVDGGLDSTNSDHISWVAGGGITVQSTAPTTPNIVGTTADCATAPNPDADCDGIPDAVDDVPGRNSLSGTIAETLYMDLAPGETESAMVELASNLHSADVYFLLDTTEGQDAVSGALGTALTTGDYFADPTAVTCADTDFDGMPNDELKDQGIVGNLACLVRDGQLGTGWVREIPFTGPDASGVRYGDADEQLFEHRVDIGGAPGTLASELAGYQVNANYGGPNGQVQALHLLATGAESYVGWDKPALPSRTGCAGGAFGYPCFRTDALPMVALFTGQPMYNGPSTASGNLGMNGGITYPQDYPASIEQGQVKAGSYPHYLKVQNSNETVASAYDVGTASVASGAAGSVDNDFLTFTGNTSGMSGDLDATALNCPGLSAAGADAVFRFDVTAQSHLTLSTSGTRFGNVLGVISAGTRPPVNYLRDFPLPITNGESGTTPLDLGTLPAGVKATVTGSTSTAKSQYPRELLGCFEYDSAAGSDYAADLLYRFSVAQDMTLHVAADQGAYAKALSLFDGNANLSSWGANGTDFVAASADSIVIPGNMNGQTLRVISGYTGTGDQRQGTTLSTTGLAASYSNAIFASVGCGLPDALSPDSEINFTLNATAKIRIETSGDGPGLSPDFAHALLLWGPSGPVTCAEDNGNTPGVEGMHHALIEETLPAGNYLAIIRGLKSTDVGHYRITIKDVSAMADPLSCLAHSDAAPHTFDVPVKACKTGYTAPCPGHERSYTMVLRGFNANDASSGSGAYSFTMSDVDAGGPLDVCDASGAGTRYEGDFKPGTYYAVVKGNAAGEEGWYQLSVGNASLATSSDYVDLSSWSGGVRDELLSRGVRVLGMQTSGDAALSEQLSTMASATQAVSSSAAPLVVQLDPAAADLSQQIGQAVVGSVQSLTAGLTMDVSLRLVPPAAPADGFTFSATAVDTAGDGCDAPVNDVHMNCVAGATPQFQVTFANPPAPGSVPPNPADPHGGYWLTLQLVGDGTYVIETIPVYLIPSDVTAEPAPPAYQASGTYWQDFGTAGNCLTGERPEWTSLDWAATLPDDTSMQWKVCTAEDQASLTGCTLEDLARVTVGAACASDTDCSGGFCQGNRCQYVAGPSCLVDDDCGTNGVCNVGTCRWTSLPIDVRALATVRNKQSWMRLAVELDASTDLKTAPTLHRWRLEYECVPSE